MDDYGAGDILEIERADGATVLLPFTDRVVPKVDIAARRVVVDPPVYVESPANEVRDHG